MSDKNIVSAKRTLAAIAAVKSKAKVRSTFSEINYYTYIKKVLEEVHPDLKISIGAMA